MQNIYRKNVFTSIKLLILDVDGVLSDGKIIISNDGNEYKNFDVKDGLGIVLLQKAGIKVAVITGKESNIVINRLTSLGVDIDDIYQGQKNKTDAFNKLKTKYGINNSNIAYMGDDLPDIIIMKEVFLPAAPSNAVHAVKKYADYVCACSGGNGAVRELCDFILKQEGLYYKIVKDFDIHGEFLV